MPRSFPLLVLAAACGAPARPISTPPAQNVARAAPTIAGDYRVTHPITYVCDTGWCDGEADDVLTIRDARAGAIHVSVELTQTNVHTCTFDGTLAPEPSSASARRWAFRQDDGEEGPCTLVLESTGTAIRLSADGCRYYCGARASLDAVFPARSRML